MKSSPRWPRSPDRGARRLRPGDPSTSSGQTLAEEGGELVGNAAHVVATDENHQAPAPERMPGAWWAAIFRPVVHAGRDATADENVIARSVVCDEAISFVDGEIASQTALAMTGWNDFRDSCPCRARRQAH